MQPLATVRALPWKHVPLEFLKESSGGNVTTMVRVPPVHHESSRSVHESLPPGIEHYYRVTT